MSTDRQLRALRGATTVDDDRPRPIVDATSELLTEMLQRNGAVADDVVSVIFTTTQDLTSEFPAAAARAMAFDDVPLLCASEIAVPGSLERCVRVLMHLYTSRPRAQLDHVYLRGARGLRTDLRGGDG